jgi:hypothetical protein
LNLPCLLMISTMFVTVYKTHRIICIGLKVRVLSPAQQKNP